MITLEEKKKRTETYAKYGIFNKWTGTGTRFYITEETTLAAASSFESKYGKGFHAYKIYIDGDSMEMIFDGKMVCGNEKATDEEIQDFRALLNAEIGSEIKALRAKLKK